MTLFIPSRGRPELLAKMRQAPGGLPPDNEIHLILTNGDDRILDYAGFPYQVSVMPEHFKLCDIMRWISDTFPDKPYYAMLSDDMWPVTPGWHEGLIKAAGTHNLAYCNCPPRGNSVIGGYYVIGGDLVRLMGSFVPLDLKHQYCDNAHYTIAKDFGLLKYCPDIIVEHHHPTLLGNDHSDETYRRGEETADDDREKYQRWLSSNDRAAMYDRIAKALGQEIASFNNKDVKLVIVSPMQDEAVDIAYHSSLGHTLRFLQERGISVSVIESSGGSHIGKARERILYEALQTSATHILFIDADMGWEPDQIIRLLCADHEFSGIAGVRKTDEFKVCANFLPVQTLHPKSKFLEVKEVGFAFVMLKRCVIDKMIAAYPELAYNAGKGKTEHALFLDMIDDGERLSEDLSFCRRWRAIGGQIYLDADQAIIHAGRKQYTGKVTDLFVYEKPAQAAE